MYKSHPYKGHPSGYLKIALSTDSDADLLMSFTNPLVWIIRKDSL